MNRNISYSLNKFIGSGGLTFLSCLLCVIIIPVHVDFLPPFMMFWVVCWIIENHQRFNKIWNREDPVILLFAGFALYFLWYIGCLFFTDDIHNGMLLVFRRLPFITFPFVLIFPGDLIKKKVRLLLRVFSLSTLFFILFLFGLALVRSVYITDGAITFNPHPPEYDYANYFFGTYFVFQQHPTYMAMYVVFSMFIAFESFIDNQLKLFFRILWLLSGILLLVSLYFLSSRAGIFSALLLIPLYLIIQFIKIKKWGVSLLIVIVAMPVIIFSFLNNDRIKYYLPETNETSLVNKFMLDNRIPIWKSAIKVIKHNFVVGVGPGDASEKLLKEYKNEGYTEMCYDNLNAHNQFLEVFLGTGLIGFLIFISILLYMVYILILKRNLLFGLYISIILIIFLFESILNRIAGVTFFSLFTFLLLYLEDNNALSKQEITV
ncbi:MAG TPA: O-antigen ligase family protein [Bacteroidales bacterium]